MKANEKKPVEKTIIKNHNGVRSESLCNLGNEINLALNDSVRASDDPGFCDVRVTQFDITWQLLGFYGAVCCVLANLDYQKKMTIMQG